MTLVLWLSVLVVIVHSSWEDDVFTNKFAEIRFTPTFIDKTPLIYEVLKHEYLFINAPFRFGTSTNIGMLNFFLSNLYTKETLEEYFNGTEIWKEEAFVKENLGAHPVILYNTSACGVIYDEDHMKATFAWILYNTFLDHKYLLRSPNITGEDMKLLKVFLNRKKIQCLEMEIIFQGISFLAELLYQYHGKQVILLVDGFGRGVMERIIEDNDDLRHLMPVVVEWYNAIINHTILDQSAISRAILSAETRCYGLKGKGYSLFENVTFMEKEEFSHFYGFTYDELEYLLCKFNIPLDERPKVLKWYCGYSTINGKVKVCNPHSILCYLNSPYKLIRMYWIGSVTGPDLLQRIISSKTYQKHIHDLVIDHPINVTLTGDANQDVSYLRRMVEELKPNSQSFIFKVLLETGYLTYDKHQHVGVVGLRFPNEEVRLVIDKFVSLLSFI